MSKLNTYGSYKPADSVREVDFDGYKPKPGRAVIVFGPSAWAKGESERDALEKYADYRNVKEPHEVIIIDCDQDSSVNALGEVTRAADKEKSKEIKRVQVGESRWK